MDNWPFGLRLREKPMATRRTGLDHHRARPLRIPIQSLFSDLFLDLLKLEKDSEATRRLHQYRRRFRSDPELAGSFELPTLKRRGRPPGQPNVEMLPRAVVLVMIVDFMGLRPVDVLRAHGLDASSGSDDFKKLARYLKHGRRLLAKVPAGNVRMDELRDGLARVPNDAKRALVRVLRVSLLGNRVRSLSQAWAAFHPSEGQKAAILQDIVKATPVLRVLEAYSRRD